jgi:hypothetical protein
MEAQMQISIFNSGVDGDASARGRTVSDATAAATAELSVSDAALMEALAVFRSIPVENKPKRRFWQFSSR